MTKLLEVARVDQIPTGTARVVAVVDKSLALFNVDGTIYAIDDSCAHAGSSLAGGKLEGKIVTCPGHGLKYDVTNGYVGGTPGYGVTSYPVELRDGKVFVSIESS